MIRVLFNILYTNISIIVTNVGTKNLFVVKLQLKRGKNKIMVKIASFRVLSLTIAVSKLIFPVSGFVPASINGAAFTPSPSLSMVVDDKTEVREYFNTEGFNRWNKIYSESDDVNSVQLDIRTGHDQTIQKILNWIEDDGDIKGKTVCDCGCGVGSLAIPLAQMGKSILVPLPTAMIFFCKI